MKFKDLIDLLGLTVYDEEIKNYIKNAMSVIEAKLHAHSNKTVLDNTTASFTEALLSKLNGIEAGANKIVVDSTLSASSENPVQNKIVKSALDTKVPTSRKINGKALTADITLTASDVSAIPASEKGAAGGVAELDANGKILTSMLPGSIDEYIEGWLSSGSFYKEEAHTTKITPKTDAIYLDLHTMKTYRWSGSAYGVISETLAIGTTSSTAGRGDWTKAAYDHSLSAHAPSNAERNIIIGIQKNGTDLAIDSNTRKVNITVPTKLSELTNDKNFVDNTHTHTKANITDLNKQLTSENLDDIKSVGFYYAGGGNTTTNKPTDVDAYGMIVTHAASGSRKQILYSSSNRTYERLYNSSTWSLWRDITVETPVPTNAKFTDTNTKVTNTLATTTKAYITGTTSATTNTGTQVFDTGVYLDTVAGQLVATTFKGNLIGNVTGSITGDISGYSKSLYNYFSGRQSSLNFDLKNYNNKVFYTLATSSATEGKPPVDSSILTFAWDNSGWGAQIALGINKVAHMYIRGASSVTTDGVVSSDWASSWFTVLDSNNYNSYALPLTGGTLTTSSYYGLVIKRSDTNGSAIQYSNSNGAIGGAGFLSGGNFQISSGTNTNGNIFLANTTSATFPGTVTATKFIGALQGVADSALKADKLTTGRTIQTNLGSTSTATFDGTANITPGVTGTLPIKNGGTGATTATGILTNIGITATAAEINKLDGLTATTTELNYIDGVTSAIQGQLDSKQAVITGGATTILTSNLTNNRALVSDSDGKVAVSAITSTELGYLDGITSNIQTQLNGKIANNVFCGEGTPGTNGYVAFAQLVIKSNYTNRPIEFELICRGKATPCYVSIMFSNTNSTDPSIQSLSYWGTDYGVFAIKTTTSTWLLYYTKSERYDNVTVAKIQAAEQGVTITYPGTFITEKPTENVISAILGGSISFASTATTASKVAGTKTNPTSGTTYYIPFHTNAITENKALLNNDGLRYWTQEGTTSAVGEAEIGIGNNIASGTAGNKRGSIYMYGSSSGYTQIFPGNNTTSNINITLPSAGGTLALTTSKVSGATTADKVINALTVKLNGGSTEGTNLFTFNGSVAKTINITPSSIGASSTNHTHGLLHSSFAKLIDNTTTDSGWSMLNSTYNGYLLLSLRTQKDAPVWTIGDYSAGIAFGGADTKGIMTVKYNYPLIRFAGGNGTKPVWYFTLTGTSATTYNLDTFAKKDGTGASGTWGISISGSAPKLTTARKISLGTSVTGSASFDGSSDITINVSAPTTVGGTIPYAGSDVTNVTVLTDFSKYRSYLGSTTIDGTWYNLISVRHRNGTSDGTSYGFYLQSKLTSTGDLIWNKQYGASSWQGERTILDSSNYTSYTVKKDGTGASGTWGISITGNASTATSATKATQDGNGSTITSTYLKLSGGTMSGNLTFASVTSTTYPALSNKIVWSGSTDGADIYYRVDANDAGRLVFNLRDDANTLICFAKNGTDFATINTSGVFSGYAALLANVGANCSTGKSTWNAGIEGKIVWGQKWNSTDFTYTNSEGTATTITDSGDVSFYLTGSSTANRLYLNMAIDGSIYASNGFSGNLSGTATKATQDSAGQQINTTYIKALSVSGQTITYTKGSGATGTITTQDKNVYQSASTTSNFRPLLMGHTNTTSASSLGTAVTNQTYVNTAIFAQPSTGTIYATKFSGALVGNSDTTTKWKTARTITINGDFTGSVSLDGSANVSFNLWNYYGKVSVGNTNNYPYHRIAKLDTITSTYQDRASTLYISQDYNGAGFGIIRICLRTNNTGSASYVEAYWLVRKGLAEDSVKIGIYNVFGETYADVFFKTGGAYDSTVVRDIASGARGSVSRTWTLINSGESSGTTTTDKLASYECWVDIETAATELHSQAYSTIVTSSDAGDVYRSERAYNDESGNNIKASYAASLSVSGTTVTLKSKSGATLSTITTQDNDTKNTAGSTNSSSKLFLIGATSQATNPQTYSHDTAYVNTDGHLYSNSKQVVNLSDSQALTNKTYNGYTLGAACAKAVTNNTSVDSLGWSSSIGATNVPTMNTIAYWNGAYSGTSSNLAYCTKGAFGSIVTKNTGDYLSSSGGTLTGNVNFSNTGTIANAWRGIKGTNGENDFWYIRGSQTASDGGFLEIATADGGNEPIYVRQYSGTADTLGTNIKRTLTLLDASGNSNFPGTVTASTFVGSLTGTVSFTNNTWNSMGDDAFIGDCNQAGCIGIKGNNGATGIYFTPYSGSTAQKISIDGSGTMTITGTVASTFSGNLTGNANTATKLATARTVQTNLGSTSTASFDGSANITPGVTGTLPVLNGGTGETTVQNAFSSLSKITSGGYWNTAPTGISAWKYENNNTSTYSIPVTNCFVLVMKESSRRGVAIAIAWSSGNSAMWKNTLHDDTGSNKWKGWQSVMMGANFSLSGSTLSITTS